MKSKTLGIVALVVAAQACIVFAQESKQDDQLTRSTRRAQQRQTYLLQYKMSPGETLRWKVEQIANTDMSMAGFSEETSMKTRSVIAWKVNSVDVNGNMTIVDKLESAVEWQKIGDNDAVSYDSSRDKEAPDVYQSTAEKIGKPIATTTINKTGKVVQKEKHMPSIEFGMGKFTLTFPAEPIAIGAQWNIPEDLQARRSDQTLKTIKTRMLYTLRKVESGVATISFRREILTPIKDPKVKSQIQQKMNQGALLFDVAGGRIVKKVVQWDEKVQGFEGDDSYLHYAGKYTLEIVRGESPEKTASTSPLKPLKKTDSERSSRIIRPRSGKAIIRK